MNDPAALSTPTILTFFNIPLLLIIPLLIAAMLSYLFRRWAQIISLVMACYLGGTALFFANVDLNVAPLFTLPGGNLTIDMAAPLNWVGFQLKLYDQTLPLIVVTLLLATFALILATHIPQGHNFTPAILVLVVFYMVFYLNFSGPTAPALIGPLILAVISCGGIFALQTERLKSLDGPLRSLIPPTLAFPLFIVAALYVEALFRNPQDASAAQIGAWLLGIGLILLLAPIPLHGAHTITTQSAPPPCSRPAPNSLPISHPLSLLPDYYALYLYLSGDSFG